MSPRGPSKWTSRHLSTGECAPYPQAWPLDWVMGFVLAFPECLNFQKRARWCCPLTGLLPAPLIHLQLGTLPFSHPH